MKKVKIEIRTSALSPAFREELLRIIKEHPGACPLGLFLNDAETGHRIEFDSKKYRVSDSEELKEALSQIGVDNVFD